jgi:hypothetical protein
MKRVTMRRLLPLPLALALAAPAIVLLTIAAPPAEAQNRGRDQDRNRDRQDRRSEQTERTNRTVNIGPNGEIDLTNVAGDIIITRGSGNSATIDIVKTARAESPEAARELLGMVTVDIVERGTRVEVRTRYPEQDEMRQRGRRNANVQAAFSITAPQNTRIVARSISGNIRARDITGALTLESVSGSILLENAGRAAAKSISGNVELADTRVDGALSAGTISGTVRVQRTSVASLSVSSVSGNVLLEDVASGRIESQSVSGNVIFSGDFAANGRYEFTSHSGSVRLAVGAASGFEIEATSFSGGISSELPLTLQGREGRGPRRSMRATYGNGSAIVEVTSFSGSITIVKR